MRSTIAAASLLAACTSSAEPPASSPCDPIEIEITGATARQVEGVHDALDAWRTHGVTAFDAVDAITKIEVRFAPAGDAFHGLFDDGIVYANSSLDDRETIAIVVEHELGHAFGLPHVSERVSVMNVNNLVTTITYDDQSALEAIWGRCVNSP